MIRTPGDSPLNWLVLSHPSSSAASHSRSPSAPASSASHSRSPSALASSTSHPRSPFAPVLPPLPCGLARPSRLLVCDGTTISVHDHDLATTTTFYRSFCSPGLSTPPPCLWLYDYHYSHTAGHLHGTSIGPLCSSCHSSGLPFLKRRTLRLHRFGVLPLKPHLR